MDDVELLSGNPKIN